MQIVSDIKLQRHIKSYMSRVTNEQQTIMVTRGESKNIVIMSEKSYIDLMESVLFVDEK